MKEYIFYYITRNIVTGEKRVFTYDCYQGDNGNYIDYHNQLWVIEDWAVEPELAEKEDLF